MSFFPKAIVGIYICVIISMAIIGITNLYIPETVEEGEVYFPYFYASGPIVWFLSVVASLYVRLLIEAISHSKLSPNWGIVIIPGLLNILLGSLQWHYLTKYVISFWKKMTGKQSG